MKKITMASLLAITACLSGFVYHFFVKKCPTSSTQEIFTTEKPCYRSITQYINASGNLKAKDQISVGSLVAGRVINIKAEDNDIVKKGQILAILDNGIGDVGVKRLTAVLDEAKATLEFQEKFYKRQTTLHDSKQISDNLFEQYTQDYETAKARFEQAKNARALEQQTYENLFIKSPEDGIVIAKKIDLGQMITSVLQATVLYEIAPNLKKMEAWVDVDEADIGMIKEGQEALFTVDAFPKKQFKAEVSRIQYLAKIVDGVVTYATVLNVDNPKLRLRPGMTTNVDIKVASKEKTLSIPNKALRISKLTLEEYAKNGLCEFSIDESSSRIMQKQSPKIKSGKTLDTVWTLDGKKIKQIHVKLGVNDGRYSEVLDGLTEHDTVITEVAEIKGNAKFLSRVFSSPVGR